MKTYMVRYRLTSGPDEEIFIDDLKTANRQLRESLTQMREGKTVSIILDDRNIYINPNNLVSISLEEVEEDNSDLTLAKYLGMN